MSQLFNIQSFHTSTSNELMSIKDRVRNIIGNRNWGEEGRYKEMILRNAIKKFLPPKYIMGTGFIVNVNQDQNELGEYNCSTQIDILIFDSSYPILFSESDFYIVTPESVRAIIEVKANIQNQNAVEILSGMNNNGKLIYDNNYDLPDSKRIFNGIFSFEGYDLNYNHIDSESRFGREVSRSKNRMKPILERIITESNTETIYESFNKHNLEIDYIVNHISINKDIFIKFWPYKERYSVYYIKNLSFSFFISNLLYFLTDQQDRVKNQKKLWFPGDKESKRAYDLSLNGQISTRREEGDPG